MANVKQWVAPGLVVFNDLLVMAQFPRPFRCPCSSDDLHFVGTSLFIASWWIYFQCVEGTPPLTRRHCTRMTVSTLPQSYRPSGLNLPRLPSSPSL